MTVGTQSCIANLSYNMSTYNPSASRVLCYFIFSALLVKEYREEVRLLTLDISKKINTDNKHPGGRHRPKVVIYYFRAGLHVLAEIRIL